MNPLFKLMMKFASSPRIDMQEDYVWVRKVQNFFSKASIDDYHFLDEKIYSNEENHEIPVRIFHPEKRTHEEHIIYIHGGGWALGNIDTYTSACVNLANRLGRIVYSIDYRLAPEHPYPAGLQDCLQAVDVLMAPVEGRKERKWVLMGDSAGGNLAAAVSLKRKEENKRLPDSQVLLYPLTHWDHTENSPFESIITNGYDYGLTIKKMQEYMEMYAPDEEIRKSPYIAPLMAEDLKNQPDTLIITTEYDPLRDEGEAYGAALRKAGNYVEVKRILNSVHGFITYPPYVTPLAEAYNLMDSFLDR
jgi:acetyl esterase/lipase